MLIVSTRDLETLLRELRSHNWALWEFYGWAVTSGPQVVHPAVQ